MLILADNDIVGAVEAIRRIFASSEWFDFAAELELTFETLAGVGLAPDASDQLVWQTAQSKGAVLVTFQ